MRQDWANRMMADPSLELAGISTNSFIAPATEMTEMESWTEAAISRILLRYINILSRWLFSAGGNGARGKLAAASSSNRMLFLLRLRICFKSGLFTAALLLD